MEDEILNEEEMGAEEEFTPEELTPEEAKASLGLSTRLSEQFLMSQVPEQPLEGGQMPPGEEMMNGVSQDPSVDPEALKSEIMGEVETVIEGKMGELKEMLVKALEDDEDEPEEIEKETETEEPAE